MSNQASKPNTREQVKAKAAEAVDYAERAKRLPWWHRGRRRLMRKADAAMRDGFALLADEGPRS